MRVLMIGGTALTGPHLIRELLGRAGAVFCETALAGDRRDPAALDAALSVARPDVIVDMVAFTVGDAEGLVSALSRHGRAVPVVACSSCDVYAAYGRIHGTEDAPPQPCPIPEDGALRTRYGPEGAAYDKIGVERVWRGALANLAILRLPAIYGWPEASRIAPWLDLMLDGAPEIVLRAARARFRFSRSLHRNVAHALALAVRAGPVGQRVYNVAEERAWSEAEWAARIGAACGWRGRIVTDGSGPGPAQDLAVASDRIRDELGYAELADPDEGLAEAVRFHAWQRRGLPYEKGY